MFQSMNAAAHHQLFQLLSLRSECQPYKAKETGEHTTTVPTNGTEKTSLIWNSNGASTTYLSSIWDEGRTFKNCLNNGNFSPVTFETMNIGHNLTLATLSSCT
jgi:hypothetical protein